jgi:hypothetical protein
MRSWQRLEQFRFLCSHAVAAMPDVVRAFIRHEERERRRHQLADVVEGARPGGAEERLQFREHLFDRIEVRTVRWEKPQDRTRLLNRDADFGLLVGGEVVEDDDVAGSERRHQDLLDIRAKRGAVHRAIEHGRGRQLGGAQRRDHRVRLPVAAGRVIRDPRPAQAAGVAAEEICGHARFVDEDIAGRVVQRQRLSPPAPGSCDVGAPLFVGVDGFF